MPLPLQLSHRPHLFHPYVLSQEPTPPVLALQALFHLSCPLLINGEIVLFYCLEKSTIMFIFAYMNERIDILRGIHPGLFLKRELEIRKFSSKYLAEQIDMYPQTISAIIRGRRSMNVPLSLAIEKFLDIEEGFLMTLQIFYDIEQEKRNKNRLQHPDMDKYRSTLFWDTALDKIDWIQHKSFIINRVFERGTADEILETISFYGKETIFSCLTPSQSPFSKEIESNISTYL